MRRLLLFESGLLDAKKIAQEIAEGNRGKIALALLLDEEEAKLFCDPRVLVF